MAKTINLVTRIEPKTKDQLSRICKERDLNGSAVVRRLIEQWVNQQQSAA